MGEQNGKSPDPATLRRRAMDLLARREHATVELQRKLERKGFLPEDVERVARDLIDDGLLSDARYAEAAIRAGTMKGHGPLRLRADLKKHGVGGDLAERALAQSNVDWQELAREVRGKRFGDSSPGSFRERARQVRFLQYRGFTHDQIAGAMDESS